MGVILEQAELAWSGQNHQHPWHSLNVLEEVAPRTWFASSFANMTVLDTDEGLVIIDPGAKNNAGEKHQMVRTQLSGPAHTIIYTHGHHDHVWGADLYQSEALEQGHPAPHIVAHEAVLQRFERYGKTAGYNGIINLRQFRGGAGVPTWPVDHIPPTVTYRHDLELTVGGERLELHHARGETDDATWVFVPSRKVLVTGDLFVWVAPNAGNPQKVQRYAGEWAAALRQMDALAAELLLPGHGTPIVGAERVHQALDDTARYLESLEAQALAAMNEGLTLDAVVHAVQPPTELVDRPYLQPIYDEPDFIVRNIWRLYGGWYDGIPSHLKPAPELHLANELAAIAGSPEALAGRASALAEQGDLQLASHLADWAWTAAPDDEAIRLVRGQIYHQRSLTERSTMAVGIYRTVAREMGIAMSDEPTFRAQN